LPVIHAFHPRGAPAATREIFSNFQRPTHLTTQEFGPKQRHRRDHGNRAYKSLIIQRQNHTFAAKAIAQTAGRTDRFWWPQSVAKFVARTTYNGRRNSSRWMAKPIALAVGDRHRFFSTSKRKAGPPLLGEDGTET
jgi:hypothetical protein